MFALVASVPAAAQQPTPSAVFSRAIPQPPLADVTVVRASSPWAGRDASLAERNLGRVVVAVRDLFSRDLEYQAMIRVFDAADSTRILSSRLTDAHSRAELDSLPAGDVIVEVRQIGMVTNRARVRIAAGCTDRLEMKLAQGMICTAFSEPYRPPRATFVTCAPED